MEWAAIHSANGAKIAPVTVSVTVHAKGSTFGPLVAAFWLPMQIRGGPVLFECAQKFCSLQSVRCWRRRTSSSRDSDCSRLVIALHLLTPVQQKARCWWVNFICVKRPSKCNQKLHSGLALGATARASIKCDLETMRPGGPSLCVGKSCSVAELQVAALYLLGAGNEL